jgi:molybdopterin synthase sulfur carrier subunit
MAKRGVAVTPFLSQPENLSVWESPVVTVHIPTALRTFSDGREEVEVEGGSSLRQIIERLNAACPGIKGRILDEEGQDIHPGIAIFINDEQTSEGLIQRVPEQASIQILPAMGGGSLA